MPALRVVLPAAPALLCAAVGLSHPVFLTPQTAGAWRLGHLLLLPLFPLVGLALVWLLRGERNPLAWVARVLAYGWAVLYGALDAIAGIGAAQQVLGTAERAEPFPPLGDLYEIGDRLGVLGARSLLLAGALTAVLLARRGSWEAPVGGVVLALGAEVVRAHHVFPFRGTAGMLAVAGGTALLAVARERCRERVRAGLVDA